MAIDSWPQKLRRAKRKKAKNAMMIRLCGLAIGLAAALGSEGIAANAEGTWDAGGPNGNWSTPANWAGDKVPARGGTASVTFTNAATGAANVLDANWTVKNLTYTNTGGRVNTTNVNGNTLAVTGTLTSGDHAFTGAVITGGGTVDLTGADISVGRGHSSGGSGPTLIISGLNVDARKVGSIEIGGGPATWKDPTSAKLDFRRASFVGGTFNAKSVTLSGEKNNRGTLDLRGAGVKDVTMGSFVIPYRKEGTGRGYLRLDGGANITIGGFRPNGTPDRANKGRMYVHCHSPVRPPSGTFLANLSLLHLAGFNGNTTLDLLHVKDDSFIVADAIYVGGEHRAHRGFLFLGDMDVTTKRLRISADPVEGNTSTVYLWGTRLTIGGGAHSKIEIPGPDARLVLDFSKTTTRLRVYGDWRWTLENWLAERDGKGRLQIQNMPDGRKVAIVYDGTYTVIALYTAVVVPV